MGIYVEMFNYIKTLPKNSILLIILGIVVFCIYAVIKKKKSTLPTYFRTEIGKEFATKRLNLLSLERKVKNDSVKEKLSESNKIARKIYKLIIDLTNKEINQKLNSEHINKIFSFVNERLTLTQKLIGNYIQLENSIVYAGGDNKVVEENETVIAMQAIEYEMEIIVYAYAQFHDELNIAINGKRAKLINKRLHGVEEVQTNTSNIQDIQNTIVQLNNGFKHDNMI